MSNTTSLNRILTIESCIVGKTSVECLNLTPNLGENLALTDKLDQFRQETAATKAPRDPRVSGSAGEGWDKPDDNKTSPKGFSFVGGYAEPDPTANPGLPDLVNGCPIHGPGPCPDNHDQQVVDALEAAIKVMEIKGQGVRAWNAVINDFSRHVETELGNGPAAYLRFKDGKEYIAYLIHWLKLNK